MKKKTLLLTFTLIAALGIAACGREAEEEEERPRVRTESQEEETEPAAEEEEEEAEKEAEAEPETDYEAYYAPVLEEVEDVLLNGYDSDKEYRYLASNLMEEVMYGDRNELLSSVGYVISDLNGDGAAELIIGRNEERGYDGPGEQSRVYGCYNSNGDEPGMIFEGMVRSSFFWKGDGHFYYQGSGGAMYTMFGECHISDDAAETVWDDFYFTDTEDGSTLQFYHNTSGVYDTKASDKMDIDEDAFYDIFNDYLSAHGDTLLEWTLIASDKAEETVETDGGSPVHAEWADGVTDESTEYISYEPEHTDEYTTHVLFTADREVTDFKMADLQMTDVTDDGKPVFDIKEHKAADKLTPGKPLCAGVNFPGDMPTNGFMYTDESGKEHFFVMEVSGLDGSLSVWEYER